jgi:hypothetical protein
MMLRSNEKQSRSPKMDILVQYSLIKLLTQGLGECLFLFLQYLYLFYFVSQVLCTCTDNRSWFSMRNSFFYL